MNAAPVSTSLSPPRRFGWGLVAALLAAVALIGIVGFFYLQSVTTAARKVATENLAAVAESKVREIVNWRAERLSHARAVTQNPFIAEPVQRFLIGPADAASTARLTQWLQSLQEHNQALRAILVDAECKVRLVFPADKTYFGPVAETSAKEAMATNHVMVSELHRSRFSGEVHLDMVVPIRLTTGAAPVGAVVLEVDPERFLFPLIQAWPTASPSAETLLIRQEGNDVLYLNELRHRKGAALTLRLPIGDKDLPAARAVRGETGTMAGVDYRGVPVLAHVRAVPGTRWFLVAKVDAAEINAPLRQQTLLISVSVGLLILAVGLGAGLFWRQQRVRHYREQAETAEALRDSEIRYRRLFEAARDGVLILDAETGLVMDVNPYLIELLGVTREVFLGKKVWELGFFKDAVANEANFAELKAKQYIRYEDMALEGHDGQRHEVEFVSNVYLVNNQKVIQCNIRDISERVRTALALKEKHTELERFLYTVSHDLKSPVVTARTFLGYLEQDMAAGDAAKIAADVNFIRVATDKMAQLLDNVLEVARIGRVVSVPVNVTLRALVDDALGAVAGRIAERGVAVTVNEHGVTLHGDRVRLAEVFQNLIDNACKFMGDQKEPRIEIGVMEKGSDGELGSTQHSSPPVLQSSQSSRPPVLQSSSSPVFFVRDNGVGIDPRHRAKVFELFEKIDPQAEGTGIGLALVKRIVELHGGRIWVESKGAGQGTCFCFTLPGAMKKQEAEVRIQKPGDRL